MPHSDESERMVLGALMNEKGALPEVRELLPLEAFYSDKNRMIYKVVCEVADRGDFPDLVTVMEEITRHKFPVQPYELAETCGKSTPYYMQHATAVFDKYKRRQFFEISCYLRDNCFDETEDIVDVYDALIHGGGEGLEVLLRIVPSLIALMTAAILALPEFQAARRVLGHFREMAQGGAGVLLITHDLELALTIADRVAVFYAGETVEEANAADFEAGKLRHPYTKALWNALPQNGFVPIPGAQPGPGEVGEGCPFAPRCPKGRPECMGPVAYRELDGGLVRCLYPEGGEQP